MSQISNYLGTKYNLLLEGSDSAECSVEEIPEQYGVLM